MSLSFRGGDMPGFRFRPWSRTGLATVTGQSACPQGVFAGGGYSDNLQLEQDTGMELRYRLRMIAGVMALAAFAGCGRDDLPELAPVEGTVTLDGIPLPGVLVSFYPSDGGRPGTCETDDEGHYNLIYVSGEEGTRLGKNRVEVSMVWPDGEPTPGLEDVVPSQYKGTDSVLSCDVKAEDNVYDIKMETPVGGQ